MRNNKSAGQKHLRCFPLCVESGHCLNGFCGRPVSTTATVRGSAKARASANFVAFGEFIVQEMTSGSRKARSNAVQSDEIEGQRVSKAEMEGSTRTEESPSMPLYRSYAVSEVSWLLTICHSRLSHMYHVFLWLRHCTCCPSHYRFLLLHQKLEGGRHCISLSMRDAMAGTMLGAGRFCWHDYYMLSIAHDTLYMHRDACMQP